MNIVLPRLLKLIIPFLLCACIISASSGCTYVEIGGDQGDETTEMIAVETVGRPVKPDSEQAVAITEHLEQLSFDREVDAVTMESKINLFRSGGSPLHVRLDPNIFYFICGYYDSTHENETEKYCCASDYIWIEYESEKEIREFYNGTPLVAAFQINKSIEVRDILEGKIPPSFEHYQIYEPIFENGINVSKPAGLIEESFIYLNASDDLDICHSSSAYYHGMMTIPCVEIDGEYYVTMPLDQNGESLDALLSREFGEYAEMFASIIDVEKYSVTDERGQRHSFGVFEKKSFMKKVSRIVAKDRLISQLKKDIGTDEKGSIDIKATMFLLIQTVEPPWYINLHVSNDKFYLNKSETSLENIEIIINPDFEHPDVDLFILKDATLKRSIFQKIQNAKSCYFLSRSDFTGDSIAIYVVDGNYYITTVAGIEEYGMCEMYEYKIGE